MGKEFPIIFSQPMIPPILNGTKIRTRRLTGLKLFNKRPNDWRYDGVNKNGDHLMFDVAAATVGHEQPDCIHVVRSPYGKPGDLLWVREIHHILDGRTTDMLKPPKRPWPAYVSYGEEADSVLIKDIPPDQWRKSFDADDIRHRPSIHMPRWASRIDLEVCQVWIERLNDITDEQAKAEGVEKGHMPGVGPARYRHGFHQLWFKIHGNAEGSGWHWNPWVWVVGFKRIRP